MGFGDRTTVNDAAEATDSEVAKPRCRQDNSVDFPRARGVAVGLRVRLEPRLVTASVFVPLSPVWGCLPGGRRHRAQRHQGGRGNAEEQDGGEKAESKAGKGNGPVRVPQLPKPSGSACVPAAPAPVAEPALRCWRPLGVRRG